MIKFSSLDFSSSYYGKREGCIDAFVCFGELIFPLNTCIPRNGFYFMSAIDSLSWVRDKYLYEPTWLFIIYLVFGD